MEGGREPGMVSPMSGPIRGPASPTSSPPGVGRGAVRKVVDLRLGDDSEAAMRAVEELSFLTVWLPTENISCREIEKLVWGTMSA